MKEVEAIISTGQSLFRQRLESLADSGMTKEMYIRFLSMQYHLTNGVQRHFFTLASNTLTARKKELRKWLIQFAQEEEFHFEIAKADLKELGTTPLDCPFDTKLWWLYFDTVIHDRPFIRLGATCILENIADGSSEILDHLIKKSAFLNPKNLRFLTIHRHGPNLDHGSQIIHALAEANLTEDEYKDVITGAEKALVFYMRLTHWIISGKELF